MLIYSSAPIVYTDQITSVLAKHSEDPVKQVVCIAFDTDTMFLVGYGVNKVLKPLQNAAGVQEKVATPMAPEKKFLMVHAEIDFAMKHLSSPPHVKQRTGLFLSVQPCMNCLNFLLQAGYRHIYWKTENRHQEEQALIAPFVKHIDYIQKDGFYLQVPQWIIPEYEFTKTP